MSSSSSENHRRRSTRRATAAATGGASAAAGGGSAAAAPARSVTARRRRSEDPFGKKIDFEEMESGTRYMAVEKTPFVKGGTKQVVSGVFDAVYEPDGSIRTPSGKPYVVMKAGKHEKGHAFLGRVFIIGRVALIPLDRHVGYLNPAHP